MQNIVDGRDLATSADPAHFEPMANIMKRTAGEPSIDQRRQWLHTLMGESRTAGGKLRIGNHPLRYPWCRRGLQLREQTSKHITAETERKRPASTLPMKSAARVRDVFVESAETEIAPSPPPAAQLMLPTLEVKQHLPKILPLEVLQGIPLQTQGRQQVPMVVRLFFEGGMTKSQTAQGEV